MKKISIFLFLIILSCTKQVEKPKITLNDYEIQATTSKGVVEKILNENDYKKMHEIALAVESSRSISCIQVSDECNVLGKILNLIVKSTNEGLPNQASNIAIYKQVNLLAEEFRKGHEMLELSWKEYNKAQASTKN